MARSKKSKTQQPIGRNKPVGSLTRAAIKSNKRLCAGYGDLINEKKKQPAPKIKSKEVVVDEVKKPDPKIATKVARLFRKSIADFEKGEIKRATDSMAEGLSICQEVDGQIASLLITASKNFDRLEIGKNTAKKLTKSRQWMTLPHMRIGVLMLLHVSGQYKLVERLVNEIEFHDSEAPVSSILTSEVSPPQLTSAKSITSGDWQLIENLDDRIPHETEIFSFSGAASVIIDLLLKIKGLSTQDLSDWLSLQVAKHPAAVQYVTWLAALEHCEKDSPKHRAYSEAIESCVPLMDNAALEVINALSEAIFAVAKPELHPKAAQAAIAAAFANVEGRIRYKAQYVEDYLQSDEFNALSAEDSAETLALASEFSNYCLFVKRNKKQAVEILRLIDGQTELNDRQQALVLEDRIQAVSHDLRYSKLYPVLIKEIQDDAENIAKRLGLLEICFHHYGHSKSSTVLINSIKLLIDTLKVAPKNQRLIGLMNRNLMAMKASPTPQFEELIALLNELSADNFEICLTMVQYCRAIGTEYAKSLELAKASVQLAENVSDFHSLFSLYTRYELDDLCSEALERAKSKFTGDDLNKALGYYFVAVSRHKSESLDDKRLEIYESLKDIQEQPIPAFLISGLLLVKDKASSELTSSYIDRLMSDPKMTVESAMELIKVIKSNSGPHDLEALIVRICERFPLLKEFAEYFGRYMEHAEGKTDNDKQQAQLYGMFLDIVARRAIEAQNAPESEAAIASESVSEESENDDAEQGESE